jgi:hypothetical protein
MIVALAAGAGAASAAVGRLGVRPLLAAGMATCAVGLALLGTRGVSDASAGYLGGVLPGLLVTGTGLGLAFVALTVAAVPGGDTSLAGGAASGLYNTALQVGGAVGVAVLATVARARTESVRALGESGAAAVADGRSLALLAGSAVLAVAVGVALLMPAAAGRTPKTSEVA